MKSILTFLYLALALCSCRDVKHDPVGVVWGSFGQKDLESKSALALMENPNGETLSIVAYFDLDNNTAMMNLSISTNDVNGLLEEKTYIIAGQDPPTPEAVFLWFTEEYSAAYASTNQNSSDPAGTVTITQLDRQKRLVSGTFHATVQRTDELITIRNGRFNELRY